jgi:molybdopterin molybdotransferase
MLKKQEKILFSVKKTILKTMISVEQAERIILAEHRDYGKELLPLSDAMGRVLAQDIYADRDFPPYHRVTMDGIAIDYQGFCNGNRVFKKKAVQAAGVPPIAIDDASQCIEIMTGAVLPESCNTVIRYEDLSLADGFFTVQKDAIRQGQNIHYQGQDKQKGELVIAKNQHVTAALIQMAASVGATHLWVKKLPRIVVISSGDELVDIHETPDMFQIRRSNSYTLQAALKKYGIIADTLHLPDNEAITKIELQKCLTKYDILVLSGGISMGKFDYIPQALEAIGVTKLFHKVAQKPGKPFWFGKTEKDVLVFALPGNPVSTFLCFHRYVTLWLDFMLGLKKQRTKAILGKNIHFSAQLTYFAQVSLHQNEQAQLVATPVEGNGSGDFANLLSSNAFIELEAGKQEFLEGEVYPIWLF